MNDKLITKEKDVRTWDIDKIKRRLRRLKKDEVRVRSFYTDNQPRFGLVWKTFFDTKAFINPSIKYDIKSLCNLSDAEFEDAVNDFFYNVYYMYCRENGYFENAGLDPSVLSFLELSMDATPDMVRKKFRALAKQYHPDHGGDAEKFVELKEKYDKLKNNK